MVAATMLLFGIFEDERVTLDVSPGMTVKDFKKIVQEKLNISDDLCKFDKTVISLSYARAELQDPWVLSDLGIIPGTTIRIELKEEDNPVLYIKCSHNNETLTIFDHLNVGSMPVKDLKSLVSKKTGLPVGIFRLCTTSGRELYDCHVLDVYGIEAGNTLHLENWDGLNEFFNLASRGFTPQVISQINLENIQGRYLLKVALHIAAHFGNVDLARSLIKMGARCDEPIKDPPQRQWCNGLSHIDNLKAPVHVATEMGQVGILRLFVNNDISCLMAEDGYGRMPMNIALQKKVKNCASYILSKQWTKVNLTKTVTVGVPLYANIKRWCEKAKERTYLKYGVGKSSLKKRTVDFGPLVSHGVLVDGFSKSTMNGRPKAQMQKEDKEKRKNKDTVILLNDVDPEYYFKNLAITDRSIDGSALPDKKFQVNFGKHDSFKAISTLSKPLVRQAWKDGRSSQCSSSSTPDISKRDTENSVTSDRDRIKLPPILEKNNRHRIVSQSQPALNMSPRGSIKFSKSGLKGLSKNKSSFLMNLKQSKGLAQSLPNVSIAPGEYNTVPSASVSVPSTERSERAKNVGTSLGSHSSITEEPEVEDVADDPKTNRHRRGKKNQQNKINKSHSTDAPIPLPLISNESGSRPFFYLNGLREDDVIEPTVDLLSKYKGGSPRERAIKSLVIANNFKEKPWLSQVRMALSLSTKSMKRDVKLRKSARKQRNVSCSLTPVQSLV